MIPVVIAALLLAMTAIDAGYNVYATNQTTKASDKYNAYVRDFYGASEKENNAYFDRYLRAHHLDPSKVMFPYRTGMIFNESQLYGAGARSVSNEYARYGSYVHGATNTVKSGAFGYGATHRSPGSIPRPLQNPNQRKLSDFYGY